MGSGVFISRSSRAAIRGLFVILAVVLLVPFAAGEAGAKSVKKSASATSKVPSVTRVDPMKGMPGDTLTVSGRNFIKGKNKMRVMLQRDGSKRRFTVLATAKTTKSLTFIVPNITTDLPTTMTTGANGIQIVPVPTPYKIRLISKFGIGPLTKIGKSPTLGPASSSGTDTSGAGDCDADGVINANDTDDDNDLLADTEELTIGTDPCSVDTDQDGPSDYYEYRVGYEFNGGPVLSYPSRSPYPNPKLPDALKDYDGDGLQMFEEYDLWRMTGRMDRFYSDANQDSDADSIPDDDEDEDGDLLLNWVELRKFIEPDPYLSDVLNDTDGDGLCDGLDDQDHDGPAIAVADADCTTTIPVLPNGNDGTAPIDGDDNIYSNWYEWRYSVTNDEWFDPCKPSVYPTSPMCPHLSPHDGLP